MRVYMWAMWVHPHEPAYVMWVDLRVRGSLRRSWPSGLAAWPAPLASLFLPSNLSCSDVVAGGSGNGRIW